MQCLEMCGLSAQGFLFLCLNPVATKSSASAGLHGRLSKDKPSDAEASPGSMPPLCALARGVIQPWVICPSSRLIYDNSTLGLGF